MGHVQSFQELMAFFLRKAWLILLIGLLGSVGALLFALSKANSFEAVAALRVDSPTVNAASPSQSAAPTSAALVLQGIEQRLTTRESLLAMVERHGLFKDLPAMSDDDKVFVLRSMFRFQMVDSAAGQAYGQARAIAAVLIFAQNDDPELAARIANDIAQSVVDMSAEGQREKSQETLAFFEAEVMRLQEGLTATERAIADFKNENADLLPGMADALRDELTGLESDRRQTEQAMAALAGQIAQLEAKDRLRETDRRQIADFNAQYQVLAAQGDQSASRRAAVEAKLARLPEVERGLSSLERQAEDFRQQYQSALARKIEAETAEKLVNNQQAERFSILERAIRPEAPIGGGRKKIALMGAVASLLMGTVLAFVLELALPVVRTAAQMERELGIVPVICIPDIRHAGRSGGGVRPWMARLWQQMKARVLPRRLGPGAQS